MHPPRGARRTNPTRVAAVVGGLAKLEWAHRQARFDAVLSTFHWPCKVVPGVPMAGFIHDLRLWNLHTAAGYQAGRKGASALAISAILRTWDVVFTPSLHVAADVRRLVPGHRVEVVGEGLDHFEPLRTREPGDRTDRDTIVVFAGRAEHKRALLGLCAAELAVRTLGCSAVVLGDVPRAPADPRVTLRRGMSDRELVRLLERSGAAIAPTAYEGFGLAAGEAMWFGVPVVHAEDCPMEDLVEQGGMRAAPTPEALADTTVRVWQDPDFAERAAVRARRYTWKATASRMLESIDRVRGR